jgi:hypothetical protein
MGGAALRRQNGKERTYMIRRMQILSALGGIIVALACSVHAQAAPSLLRVIAVTDRRSDNNLRWARQRINNNVDMLQQDRHEYDGHRTCAIALFAPGPTTTKPRLGI